MTAPIYPVGWPAESKVCGIAESPSDYAWNVNLHNGNVNRNNQTNQNHVRAVRAGECQQAITFRALHAAWRAARAGKKPSMDQLAFDNDWIENLIDLQERLLSLAWHPGRPTCFIATAPKAREIHAPAFADRVVHHLVVPHLERIYEPVFIHDSYSNRRGKGTHAAVDRLQAFVRQVHSGQGGGFYLQLDIRNFFNSIHRPTLYRLLKIRMERHGLPAELRRAVHSLLTYPIERTGVIYACSTDERAAVPPHKRLQNAAPGCGIAIGNLSSQFFANVYLDRLDQFVKHELKAERYLRYVDDFVLVHRNAGQLATWRDAIEVFLEGNLKLELKREQKLLPLERGIDFLGYVVFPTHRVVRRRVIGHARAKLAEWERRGDRSRRAVELLRSIVASYLGHFAHASSRIVVLSLSRRFPWLHDLLK